MTHETMTSALAVGIFLLAGISMILYIYFEVKKARRDKAIKDLERRVKKLEKNHAEMSLWQCDVYKFLSAMTIWHYENNTGLQERINAYQNAGKSGDGGEDDCSIDGRSNPKPNFPKGGNGADYS